MSYVYIRGLLFILSGNIRPVQRCLFPRTVPAARGIVWQWSGDAPGHWHAYDMRSQQILEAAAMQNQTNVDLSQPPINMPYAIDLRRMIQVRTNTGNTRSVRRLTTTPYAPDSGQPAMAKQQSAPPTLAAATAATNFGARTRSQTRRAASMGMGPTSTPMTVQPGPVLGSVFGWVGSSPYPWLCFNTKTVFPDMGISLINIRHVCTHLYINSLRPRPNGCHFADSTLKCIFLKCIFLNDNRWIQSKISLKFVPKDPIDTKPALVQIMAWCRPGDKPFSEPIIA